MRRLPGPKALKLIERQGAWVFEASESEAQTLSDLSDFVGGSLAQFDRTPAFAAGGALHPRIVAVLQAMSDAAGRSPAAGADAEFRGKCREYRDYLNAKLGERGAALASAASGFAGTGLDESWREETAVVAQEILGHLANHIDEILVPAGRLSRSDARNDAGLAFARSLDDSAKARRYMYIGDETAIVEMHNDFSLFLDLRDLSLAPTLLQTGWWEPWIEQVVKSCLSPGDSYVNAGANFGFHACHGAKLVEHTGKAFVFEANPAVFAHLRRSIFYNGFAERATLFNAAVWSEPGELKFSALREQVGRGQVASLQPAAEGAAELLPGERPFIYAPDAFEHFEVKAVTLDETVGQRVEELDLLQMDIEGSEGAAILGGRDLIRRSRNLRLILEWSVSGRPDGALREQSRAAASFLQECGFNFYRIEPPRGNVFSTAPDLKRIEPSDLLALPHSDLFVTRR